MAPMRKKAKITAKDKTGPLSKAQQAVVANIAAKVARSLEEKKSYLSADIAHAPLDGTWVIRNLFFPMSQGDDAENYLGKKISVSHLTFRIQAVLGHLTNFSMRQGRVVVFWSKDTITTTSVTSTGTELTRSPRPTNTTLQHLDYSKIVKLYEINFTLTPSVTNSTNQPGRVSKQLLFKVPMKDKKLTFTDNNNGILKDGQYFIAFSGFDGSATQVPIDYGYQYNINYYDA